MNAAIRQKRTIWIDLDNSPHVPFFAPIIRRLEENNFQVLTTARDCFQVLGLARLLDLPHVAIGRHYGKNTILKVAGTFLRASQLAPIARNHAPILAVSHGSRSQLVASFFLRIPTVMLFDYEYTNKAAFFRPSWNMAPEAIPTHTKGYNPKRSFRYPGLKEDVYALTFQPEKGIREQLNIDNKEIQVTIRPPATEAHYHTPESDKLFNAVIDQLATKPSLRMVILPRNQIKQRNYIEERWSALIQAGKVIIPDKVLNGLDLIWESDLVISGGGTMNREAASLGVPVYSIFRGRIGRVDQYLASQGRLTLIETEDDIPRKIRIAKRRIDSEAHIRHPAALDTIVSQIIQIVDQYEPSRHQ